MHARLLALWLSLPGCYLAHGVPDAGPDTPPPDAPDAPDAPLDAGPPDAGPPRALRWVPIADAPGALRPPARYGHYAVIDPVEDRMIVLGGTDPYCCGELLVRSDVWALDLRSGTWSQIGELSRPLLGSFPIEAALDRAHDRIVILSAVSSFGDEVPTSVAVDLSSFTVTPIPDGPWPHPGGALRAAFDAAGHRIVVNDAYYLALTEGVWVFDLDTDRWETIPVDGAPGQLFHTPMTMIGPGRALIYSGYDGESSTARVWQLDLTARRFELLDLPVEMGGRYSHRAVFEPARGTLAVLGGMVFTLDRDTLLLDPERGIDEPTLEPELPPRREHTAVFDAARRRAIVFGGAYQSERALDDTWALELP